MPAKIKKLQWISLERERRGFFEVADYKPGVKVLKLNISMQYGG